MKYKLTDGTIELNGKTLFRIQALKNFGNVKAGDLGGYIESEKNLSQENNCWVSDNARVYGDAWVFDDAQVSDNAQVFNNALVFSKAQVSDNAWVFGTARVLGNAWAAGNTQVFGKAQLENGYIE